MDVSEYTHILTVGNTRTIMIHISLGVRILDAVYLFLMVGGKVGFGEQKLRRLESLLRWRVLDLQVLSMRISINMWLKGLMCHLTPGSVNEVRLC